MNAGALTPPDARLISVLPDIVTNGWRMKFYGVSAEGSTMLRDLVDATVALAPAALPCDPAAAGRHAVGFAIAHDGLLGRWAMYFWWSHGVLFHQKLYSSPVGADEVNLVEVSDDVVACVYEMSIIEWERQVWVRRALTGGDIEGYVAVHMPCQPAISPGGPTPTTRSSRRWRRRRS